MTKKLASVGKKILLIMAAMLVLVGLQPLISHAQTAPRVRFGRHSDTVLHIKFRDNANVSLVGNDFVGQGAGAVNAALSQSHAQSKQQLFHDNASNLKAMYKSLTASGAHVSDLSQYFEVKIAKGENIQNISDSLRTLPYIEDAYPEPLPTPLPTTPNYTSMELFRSAAPTGINSSFASSWPGGLGGKIKLADLEYNWNTAHEDLSKARLPAAKVANGTPVDPLPDNNQSINHGTAVLGILSGDSNTFGVTGLVPNTALRLVNTYSAEGGLNVANAVYTATNNLAAGDVMLIEQESCGPADPSCNSGYVPVEWLPEVYDAITYATAQKIIVVEPAANGGQNLDDTNMYGSTFPSGKPDSGAIIVGAGAACSNGAPARSRLSFSNYGARVNMQGFGECVTTTGYGGLWDGGPNALYTNYFNGTSSASPIVAGAAASFASAYKFLNGTAPTPALVRDTLLNTGTAQNFATGSESGNIGPLPNLASALLATDQKAPTAPTNLTASLNVNKKVVLQWTAATDNVGIASYKIYRNNVWIKTITPSTTYTDTSVVGKKTYQYKLTAVDRAGHVSPFTPIVSISTK